MKLSLPLDGVGITPGVFLTQSFGEKLNDYTQFGMKGHNGLDFAAPLATPIRAAHDGQLDFIRETDVTGKVYKGYGLNARIIFSEEGVRWETIYGHMQKFEGSPRPVREGEIIGYVNSSGFSTGNHLHFGLRKWDNNGVVDYNNGYFGYIDPKPYFKIRAFQVQDGKEIRLEIPLDTMQRWQEMSMEFESLKDYQLEKAIIKAKRPYPSL